VELNIPPRRNFLDEFRLDTDQIKKDASKREEEAKNAASKVMFSVNQTKAVVQAGLLAAQRSAQMQAATVVAKVRNDEARVHQATLGKNSQTGDQDPAGSGAAGEADGDSHQDGNRTHRRRRRRSDVDGDVTQVQDGMEQEEYSGRGNHRDRDDRHAVPRRDRDDYDQDIRSGHRARGSGRYDPENDQGEDPEYETYYADERHDRGSAARSHDDRGRDRGRRGGSYDDSRGYSDGHRRRSSSRDDRPRQDSRQSQKQAAVPERSDGKPEVKEGDPSQAGSRRKRHLMDLLKATRSVSPLPAGQRRKTEADGFARSSGHNEDSAAGLVAIGGPGVDGKKAYQTAQDAMLATKAAAAEAAPAKPPRLRQLAFKNGWAEYIDQDSGKHVFKNVFTGEMSSSKPRELQSQITDAQNQRRLQWLSNHRTAAIMSDLGMTPPHGAFM